MPRGAPVTAMSRREDGFPEEEGTLDYDGADDDEYPVVVDETSTPRNGVNNFGTEEYNSAPTDNLGLNQEASLKTTCRIRRADGG